MLAGPADEPSDRRRASTLPESSTRTALASHTAVGLREPADGAVRLGHHEQVGPTHRWEAGMYAPRLCVSERAEIEDGAGHEVAPGAVDRRGLPRRRRGAAHRDGAGVSIRRVERHQLLVELERDRRQRVAQADGPEAGADPGVDVVGQRAGAHAEDGLVAVVEAVVAAGREDPDPVAPEQQPREAM